MAGPVRAGLVRVRKPVALLPFARIGRSRIPFALQCDGVAWRTQSATSTPWVGTSFTVAAWAKRTDTTALHAMVGGQGANGPIFGFTSASSTGVQWFIDLAQSATSFTNVPNVAPGNWCHVVIVHDGANDLASLYVNGVFVATNAYTLNLGATPAGPQIGARGTSSSIFKGSLADVYIWQALLTATEIKALYAQGVIAQPGLLVGHWPMTEGATNRVGDTSINGNAGLLSFAGAPQGPQWSQDVPNV